MSHDHTRHWHSKQAALALMSAIIAASAMAANTPQAEALARYQQERGACLDGQSNEDRTTCLKEANAAYAAAKKGQLDNGAQNYASNALERCKPLPAEERKDCEARMQGQGTTTGSVASGGILRELVTVQVGSPAASAAAQ